MKLKLGKPVIAQCRGGEIQADLPAALIDTVRVSLWHDRGMPSAECCLSMLDTVCGFFAELSGVFVIVTVILR